MEHLLYVMWHDYWKPWILDKLDVAKYVAIGLILVFAIPIGWIWLTIEINRAFNS